MIVLLCTSLLTKAQQALFTSNDFPGIERSMINSNRYYLPLNNSEFLFAVSKAHSDDVTIIKADKTCKTLWTLPNIEGYLSVAVLGKNILVFSAGNSGVSDYYFPDFVHATLLDNASGKIIAEKDIPDNAKACTDIHILTDSVGNFKYLILRPTELEEVKRVPHFNARENFGHTVNLQVITFDNNLNINTNNLDVSTIQKAAFLGCTSNDNNDIFLAFIQNNTISVFKYNAGASASSATVTAECNFEHDVAKEDGIIRLYENKVWLACKLDDGKKTPLSLVTGIFDFNSKKGLVQQVLLEKDYLKKYVERTGGLYISRH